MNRGSVFRTAFVVSSLVLAWKVEVTSAVTPFVHETVDATGFAINYTSLALDAQGNPHISYGYFDGVTYDLKYTSKRIGVWSLETVDAAGNVGQYSSLALDAQGNPCISYYDLTNTNLKYASKLSGVWTLETVDAGGNVGQYTSLALDALGNPRISYYDVTNGNLKYASKSSGIWTLATVDTTGVVGQYTSLALDALGNPHISYANTTSSDLKYASKSAGTWTVEAVDDTGGSYTSLALDAQGNPHISYYDVTTTALKYAGKGAAVWTLQTVDLTGTVGSYTSLALDAQGNPHISYHDLTNTNLKYASKSGAVWTLETVDAPGQVGTFTSLALDPQGNPRISYYDATQVDLKYTDAAVHVLVPEGGETWPVGSLRTIEWSGVGPVDVLLSVDGGKTYDLLREGLISHAWEFLVPHAPTSFASLRVHRADPLSTAETDSFFTIEASIALLSLKAEPASGGGGVLLSWNTDPGPEDLAGYKIERQEGADWRTVIGLTQGIAYADPEGKPGDRYRLSGINGLGEEFLLGEITVTPRVLLAAWPLPYRQGDLSISFAAAAGPGGAETLTEVSLYDLSGRLVRTIIRQTLPSGYYTATWDGRNDSGEYVPSGLYFLRSRTAGSESTYKVVVLR